MDLKTTFSSVFLFSLFLLVSTIDGRKDLGKYWEAAMKDEPMPEAIKNLINVSPSENVQVKDYAAEKLFAKILDPIPNISVYHDDAEKSFVKIFDPIPNISVYHDDVHPNELKSIEKDCDSHHDSLKEKKLHMDDFEPRPNISVYSD